MEFSDINIDSIKDASFAVFEAGKEYVMWGLREVSQTWNDTLLPIISDVANRAFEFLNSMRGLGALVVCVGAMTLRTAVVLREDADDDDTDEAKLNVGVIGGVLGMIAGVALVIFGDSDPLVEF